MTNKILSICKGSTKTVNGRDVISCFFVNLEHGIGEYGKFGNGDYYVILYKGINRKWFCFPYAFGKYGQLRAALNCITNTSFNF